MLNKSTFLFPSSPGQGFLTFSCPSPVSTAHREPRALAPVSTTVQKACRVSFPTAWAAAPIALHCPQHTQEGGSIIYIYRLSSRNCPFTHLCLDSIYSSIYSKKLLLNFSSGKSPILHPRNTEMNKTQSLPRVLTGGVGQVKRELNAMG